LPNNGHLTPPSTSPSTSYITISRTSIPVSDHGYIHLPPLPALYLPAPFTSSHPAFVRLSTVATNESQRLRNTAEEELALATRRKLVELECAEQELKRQVQLIWRAFRDGVNKAQERQAHAEEARIKSPTTPSEVIRDFVPQSDAIPLLPSTNVAPRKSALSESLRQSGMHYVPKIQSTKPAEPPVAQSAPVNAHQAHWRMDEAVNIAASVRWAEFAERMEQERKVQGGDSPSILASKQEKTNKKTRLRESPQAAQQIVAPEDEASKETASSSVLRSALKDDDGESKANGRKVKFDTQPDVVTISTDMPPEHDLTVSAVQLEPEGEQICPTLW
jgi:hypothetical protein